VKPLIWAAGPIRFVPPEALASIAEGLARENLSDTDIRGILGANLLRIATEVWR
jgi:membrane dipeptidase